MAYNDPATDKQLNFMLELAAGAITGYSAWGDLDELVQPIYGCSIFDLNRGQAGMVIDDLQYHLGVTEERPDYPSIFGETAPRPRSGAGRD